MRTPMAAVKSPIPERMVWRARSEKRAPNARPISPPTRTVATFNNVPVTGLSVPFHGWPAESFFRLRRGNARAAVFGEDQHEAQRRSAVQVGQERGVLDLSGVNQGGQSALRPTHGRPRQVKRTAGGAVAAQKEAAGGIDVRRKPLDGLLEPGDLVRADGSKA